MYRQITPAAPMTGALTLPLCLMLALGLTVGAWELFGVVGVLGGWMLMIIPGVAYLLGLPMVFAAARVESAVRRQRAGGTSTGCRGLQVDQDWA